jgi:hypothetical protein
MSDKEVFDTGAVRDSQSGKLRYDLIPVGPLERLAGVYTRGAIKYSDNNWRKGFPYMRTVASILRHLFNWVKRGPASEYGDDDLAQAVFGLFALMQFEQDIQNNKLPASLDDREVV